MPFPDIPEGFQDYKIIRDLADAVIKLGSAREILVTGIQLPLQVACTVDEVIQVP